MPPYSIVTVVRHAGLAGLSKGWCDVESNGQARERLAHYRDMAGRAHASAMNAKAEQARDMYVSIAMAWEALADEMEDEGEDLNRIKH